MKKILLPILLVLGLGIRVYAQETSAKELKANKYMFSYSYDKAVKSLSNADKLSMEGQRNLAVSYHKLNQLNLSDSVYSVFINSPSGVLPEDYYNYSMVLKSNGNYEKSIIWMEKFSSIKPNDLRVLDYQTNKNEYTNMVKENTRYRIELLSVNTSSAEFGPAFYQDKVVFTSTRAPSTPFQREDNWHNEPYLDIYVSEVSNNQLQSPGKFNKSMSGKYHDGPASFSKDGKFMAFTRNNLKDKSKDRIVELQILLSTNTDNKWSEPIAFNHSDPSHSCGHPALSADGNTMFFTCDMAGGYGGADIYKTTKSNDGNWTRPINLGNKINTEGDELFPFYEEVSKNLFFTSDGRFGLGGLDIFIAEMNGNEVGKVYNAGFPLNTRFDDLSAIANDKFSKGYFASNRNGSDDIYAMNILKTESNRILKGYAVDKNNKPLKSTFITLFSEENTILDTATTAADGFYLFDVTADKNYKLLGVKEAYQDGSNTANTFLPDLIVYADVKLLKKPIPLAKQIVPKADLAEILELNPIFFDYDKSVIREDAKTELDKIVKVMNDNPNMVVALNSHTDCRGTISYNQELSVKRARSTVKYIRAKISSPGRITGTGYGEATNITNCSCDGDAVPNCSEEDYQRQRNSEFIIIRNDVTKK